MLTTLLLSIYIITICFSIFIVTLLPGASLLGLKKSHHFFGCYQCYFITTF